MDIDEAMERLDDYRTAYAITKARIAELEAELEAAKRDAARYRWLKINARRIDFAGLCVSDGAQLDARIDAAMKEMTMDDKDTRIAALESSLQACRNILTVIHGNNKHYRETHGDQKAADDAIAIYYKLRAKHAAECERRAAAEAILQDVDNALEGHWLALDINTHFARYKD